MTDLACRSCGATQLISFLSLGKTPLANALLPLNRKDEAEATYLLETLLCEACGLVQISETVPPDELFRDYVYFSSFSETMLRHAKASADTLIKTRKLGPNHLVAEIASNDGYMLKNFRDAGIPVLGIEPARNIAAVAEERGIRTVCEFFSADLATQLVGEGLAADVILANNVMAHIPEINGVIAGIKQLLKPDGVFVMETPYVKDLLDKLEFDTIYHEHVFYYSLTALQNLFQRHGLETVDVEHVAIHGGTIRVSIGHIGGTVTPAVSRMLSKEMAWGVKTSARYQEFGRKVALLKSETRSLLEKFKSQGKKIAAYGASAKGSTLMNYYGVGGLIDFIVDRSTYKQNLLSPGTHLPIRSPEALVSEMPDYCLLLTWNFAEEILQQQAEYRARGGKFIVPIPAPIVI